MESLRVLCTFVCLLPAACATTPDVTVSYFHPRLDASMKVTETITCDAADNLIVAASAAPTATYSASGEQARPVRIKSLGGTFADTALTFEFTDDGRLKSVNSKSTGQGEAVLKSAIKLITTLAAPGVLPFWMNAVQEQSPGSLKEACSKIKEWGKGEPISLTFAENLPLNPPKWQNAKEISISPDAASTARYEQLKGSLGAVCASLMPPEPRMGLTEAADTAGIALELRQPAEVQVVSYIARSGNCSTETGHKQFWAGAFQVPQLGDKFYVPLSRAAMFGKQTFAMSLSEAGTITKLQYDKDTGANEVMNVANQAASDLTTTSSEETAAMKAERERIAEQERLVACLADHTKCGG